MAILYTNGHIFNQLTIIKELDGVLLKSGYKARLFLCKCDCGNTKEIKLGSLKNGHTKSCGCLRKKYFSSLIGEKNHMYGKRGELSPSWKGGKDFGHNIRTSKEYKDWRNNCFKRDNYICQISGQVGGKLVVHHLEPFHLIINDLSEDNYRDNEILFNIGNGITITEELHKEFHKIYGSKYFTKENFMEFKNNFNI